jgi:predicted AAA+ superfamily ATPase
VLELGQIKKSVADWQLAYQKWTAQLIPRNPDLKLPSKNALALTGVRRGGKSYTAFEVAARSKKRVLYFNFEDPLFLTDPQVKYLDEIVGAYLEIYGNDPELIIWDEIHNIKGWEKWVRKAVDTGKHRLIITGSSSEMLSSEISTSIAGRCLEERIWPLSFEEYLQFKHGGRPKESKLPHEFSNYLQWGGFPEIVLIEDPEDKKKYLRQYASDIVLKDVASRHKVRETRYLDQLVVYYFTNLSSLHSYSSIKKAFGIPTDTSASYTTFLQEAFLVFEVKRFHPNLKVQSRDPKKIYVIDTGLRNVLSHSHREDVGKLAENVVCLHLMRLEKAFCYYKNQQEVDFVVTLHGKPQEAIQVSYSDMLDSNTREREVEGLMECLQETNLQQGLILTKNREAKETLSGKTIQYRPLHQWLLEKSG